MIRSLVLRTEPTVRQTQAIMGRVEESLVARGATVERIGAGGLRFKMPLPWRAPHLGLMLPITSGRVMVSAGAGGPWRVQYELNFSGLLALAIVLTAGLIVAGVEWPRLILIDAIAAAWALAYGVPYFAASTKFGQIISVAAREIVERRHGRRAERPSAGTTTTEGSVGEVADEGGPSGSLPP